jgi:hypothetical protein
MKLKINITKNILAESMYCKGTIRGKVGQNCAIGKAIYNLFGNRSWVASEKIEIFKTDIDFENVAWWTEPKYSISLPIEAAMFIDTFDKKTPFERLEMDELSFEVDIPEEVIEEIGINEVHQILEKTPSLELVN